MLMSSLEMSQDNCRLHRCHSVSLTQGCVHEVVFSGVGVEDQKKKRSQVPRAITFLRRCVAVDLFK